MKPIDDPYRDKFDFTVLVLQGGGALGAYQAGVFEGLVEAGLAPNWIAGVSIGAVNAALIAGNAPERQVERLREFWELLTSGVAADLLPQRYSQADPLRLWTNRVSAAASATFGVPGFYAPRVPPAALAPAGRDAALSVYDASALASTLERLIDFERIGGPIRLSLGAVDVESGNSTYFDSLDTTIRAEHVMASGALPPAFPPVEIGGRRYWDGGIVSNSPLWYVLDKAPPMRALIVQVDLFSATGGLPRDLDEVMERHKDIMYSSKTRFNTTHVRELQRMRASAHRLLEKIPPDMRDDPDVQALESLCRSTHIDIMHLINRRGGYSASSKDYEFSRATMRWRWNAGLEDVRRSLAHPEWLERSQLAEGIRVFDLARKEDQGSNIERALA